jgi:hypothetical protein
MNGADNLQPPAGDDPAIFPGRYPARPGVSWVPALVVACAMVGILASDVQIQRVRFGNEQQRVDRLGAAAQLFAGRNEELGQLMADSHTQLIRLGPIDGASGIPAASIAWNAARSRGALFCDELPVQDSGRSYGIWAINVGGVAAQLADINVQPGVSVYPFESANSFLQAARFEITAGLRSTRQPVVLAGTVSQAP